jgi:NAD-dependent deacetylase
MDFTGPEEAHSIVGRARRVVVITGAGISTASGIPDYRGPQGVWTKDPVAEKLSDVSHYKESVELREAAWQRLVVRFENPPAPNAGHYYLVGFESTGKLDKVITQNIDGLHLEAGNAPDKVVELHGEVRCVKCFSCGIITPTLQALKRVREGESDPRCQEVVRNEICGGVLGTNIVRFGEYVRSTNERAARRAIDNCDLVVCVGTTLFVSTVSSLVEMALYDEKDVVIINDAPTPYDTRARAVVRGDIVEVLGKVLGVEAQSAALSRDVRDRAEMIETAAFMESLRVE